jgi:heme exporter protein A
MNGPIVEARGITKYLGDRPVLRAVSLTVMPGEVVAVVGPNGAGKTTLVRVLAGAVRPTAGTLVRFGEPVADERSDTRIGYLGHRSLLYRTLTGIENLEFYARLYGLPDPRAAAESALIAVGLRPFMHDPVRTYSRGMEQRAALARAFLHRPSLLLLDEPYTGLDLEAQELLEARVRDTVAAGGAAVVISHRIEEAARLAHRVGILWYGRLGRWRTTAPGATAELAAAYRAMFKEAERRSRGI